MILVHLSNIEYCLLYLIPKGVILREETSYYNHYPGYLILDYDFYLDCEKINKLVPFAWFIEEWTYEDTGWYTDYLDGEDINFDNELDWFISILNQGAKMLIGTCVLVRHMGNIVGLRCSKNRGIILPGGKWEKGETFVQCAKRELREETGLIGENFKLVFAGASEEGFFTYAFTADVQDFVPIDSHEGTVVLTDWKTLKESRFGGFYELMEQTIKQLETPTIWKTNL